MDAMANTSPQTKPSIDPGDRVERPFKRLITSEELSEAIQLSTRSLERLRKAGMPYFCIGHRSPRYDLNECLTWLRERSHIVGVGRRAALRNPLALRS